MQRRKSLALSIPYQLDFFKQYKFLSKDKPQHILLESGRGGRYNIVGLNPVAVIRGKGETLHISESGKETIKQGNPLDLMQEYMERWKTDYNPNTRLFKVVQLVTLVMIASVILKNFLLLRRMILIYLIYSFYYLMMCLCMIKKKSIMDYYTLCR